MVQNYNLEKEISLVEAILYLEGDPLTDEALCKISGLSPEIVSDAIKALQESYASPQSGIELAKMMGGWVIMPKKDLWEHYNRLFPAGNKG